MGVPVWPVSIKLPYYIEGPFTVIIIHFRSVFLRGAIRSERRHSFTNIVVVQLRKEVDLLKAKELQRRLADVATCDALQKISVRSFFVRGVLYRYHVLPEPERATGTDVFGLQNTLHPFLPPAHHICTFI